MSHLGLYRAIFPLKTAVCKWTQAYRTHKTNIASVPLYSFHDSLWQTESINCKTVLLFSFGAFITLILCFRFSTQLTKTCTNITHPYPRHPKPSLSGSFMRQSGVARATFLWNKVACDKATQKNRSRCDIGLSPWHHLVSRDRSDVLLNRDRGEAEELRRPEVAMRPRRRRDRGHAPRVTWPWRCEGGSRDVEDGGNHESRPAGSDALL